MSDPDQSQTSRDGLAGRCALLEHVLRMQSLISRERNNPQLSSLIMQEVTCATDADRGTLYLYDSASNELRADYVDRLEPGTIVVPLKMGVIGAAIARRQSINIINAQEHEFFTNVTDKDSGYRTDTMLALPVSDGSGRALGGLQLINKFGGRFSREDEDRLSSVARRLAAGSVAGRMDADMARQEISALQAGIGCDRSAVFQLDENSGQLVSIFASGTQNIISLRIKLGIAGFVALTGESLLVADPYHDARFDPAFDRSTGYRTQNILTIPLKTGRNEILGVIQVLNKNGGCFTPGDVELLESIAGAISNVYENRNLVRDLDLQFHSLLEVMAASLDSRDKLTAGHSLRVAELAVMIASALDFTEEDTNILKVAATLHDYGKVGVDDAVLRKKGQLNPAEYQHIKTHAEKTYDILAKVRFASKYRSVPLIAASHHEALDGSGYPLGLHENEIPLMAKILTVADVFEALTADRHYRKGLPDSAAFEILDAGIGTKFDGRVVAALKQSLESRSQPNPGSW